MEGLHTQTKQVTLLHQILPISLVFSLVLSSSIVAFSSVSTAKADSNQLGTLIIDGDVANPLSLTVSNLQAMPATTVYAVLLCGGLFVTSGNWQGVQLSYLLQQAGADSQATSLEFHASDGYTVTMEMAQAQDPNITIAYQLNDQPLEEVFRLVLPGQNGGQWISMITEIAVTGGDAYHNYLNTPTPTPPPTNSTVTPAPTPTALPTTSPASTPTAPPTATPTPSATAEPTTPPTPTAPPTATPTIPTTPITPASPSAEPTQPANNSGLGDQQGQPVGDSGSGLGLPWVPVAAVAGVAVVALSVGLLVWRRRGFGR